MARTKRPALGALFALIAVGFAGIAIAAAMAGGGAWVIAAASASSRCGWERWRGGSSGERSYALTMEAGALETQALWREFKRTGDRALRDRLILTYAPLVKYVAGRLGSGLPAHVEEGDLVSYGLLGLIGAIERFDPERDIKFETYAIARIKGSIIDELRSMDWVPRSVRARARDIERAIASLEAKLHRAPNDEEISGGARDHRGGVPGFAARDLPLLDRGARRALGGASGGGDPVALIDTIEDPEAPQPQEAMNQTELREALGEAIARLPEREKLVITLYYYEELTLREIGEVLGVTESRVSQLHTKAILRLKARLGGSVPQTSA